MATTIERIEILVTELPVRVKRIFSSGSYDTGPPQQQLGKPVLVKVYAGGIVGYGQIRAISPGHFVADTTHSMVAALQEIYGPALLGKDPFDIETIAALPGRTWRSDAFRRSRIAATSSSRPRIRT